MSVWSSDLPAPIDSAPMPPRTKTRDPIDAIACPERAGGAGPIFWNMYQRWSVPYSVYFSIGRYTPLTRELERAQIPQVLAIYASASKDIHNIVH